MSWWGKIPNKVKWVLVNGTIALGIIGLLVGVFMLYGWFEMKRKTSEGGFNDYAIGATAGLIAFFFLTPLGVYGITKVPESYYTDGK